MACGIELTFPYFFTEGQKVLYFFLCLNKFNCHFVFPGLTLCDIKIGFDDLKTCMIDMPKNKSGGGQILFRVTVCEYF